MANYKKTTDEYHKEAYCDLSLSFYLACERGDYIGEMLSLTNLMNNINKQKKDK